MIPKTKLVFKKQDDLFIIAKDIKLSEYDIHFDYENLSFTLELITSKTKISEEKQNEIPDSINTSRQSISIET